MAVFTTRFSLINAQIFFACIRVSLIIELIHTRQTAIAREMRHGKTPHAVRQASGNRPGNRFLVLKREPFKLLLNCIGEMGRVCDRVNGDLARELGVKVGRVKGRFLK